ncbi:hypothetical protein [Chromohalobacter sp. 48-RD10]|uniref:hypothetical protein n=1 Tax=Chromohalobacter sp. 48-RD10 TaxID=2994063 RepID=UPI0024689A61|nr:hypothetical protein [Chromohalobacter sp. 48-RD10]
MSVLPSRGVHCCWARSTSILRVSSDTYARAKRGEPEWQVNLDEDQLARVSYLLNIHAALGVVFDDPSKVYGFMSMVNHNDGFNGRSPLDVIAQGDLTALRETWLHVNLLRPVIIGDEGRVKL